MENNEENKPVEEAKPVEPVTEAPAPTTEAQTTVEPVTEAPKKKGKGGILLVLLILVIAIFAVWFFLLGGNEMLGFKKEQEEPRQEEKQEEKKKEEEKKEEKQEENKDESKEVALSESEKETLNKYIDYFITNNTSYKTKILIKDLSSQEILLATYGINGNFDNTISEDTMNTIVKNTFGDVSFEHETIKCKVCGSDMYVYSSTNKNYVESTNHPGHGGGAIVDKAIYFESAEKNEANNTLTVKYKIVYSQICDDLYSPPENYYPTITDLKNSTNAFYSSPLDPTDGITFDTVYNEFGSKIPYTVATFGFEDSHYYLKSIELP